MSWHLLTGYMQLVVLLPGGVLHGGAHGRAQTRLAVGQPEQEHVGSPFTRTAEEFVQLSALHFAWHLMLSSVWLYGAFDTHDG